MARFLIPIVAFAVMIPIFWYTTLRNLGTSSLAGLRPVRLVREFHGVGLTLWYLGIVGLVAQRFWDYWSTLLP